MALLREVCAVIGQRDVPPSGVGKADTHFLRQNFTASGEGAGVTNELWAGYPRAQGHRWRCDQQNLASIQGYADEEPLQPLGSLLRASALKQIVGSQPHNQQISVIWESWGRNRNLPAILSHVVDGPAGFRSQGLSPS